MQCLLLLLGGFPVPIAATQGRRMLWLVDGVDILLIVARTLPEWSSKTFGSV